MPLAPPLRMANRLSVRVLNEGWFRVSSHGTLVPLATYFHPLDGIGGWNVLYGPDGFVQYQFAVPPERGDVVEDAVEAIAGSGIPAFLAVLKRFGPGTPGPLSFAQTGWTLALDFPVGPTGLSALLDGLDEMVAAAGGRIYLAKDARLRPDLVPVMYPRLGEMADVAPSRRPQGRPRLGPLAAARALTAHAAGASAASIAAPEHACGGHRVRCLGEEAHHHEVANARRGQLGDALGGDAAGDEHGYRRPRAGHGRIAQPRAGTPRFRGRRLDRPGRDVGDILRRGGVQVVRSVGGQAHDGVGAEDAPSQVDRRIVLTHVDAVGAGLERQVGPVVQHEGDAVGPADAAGHQGAGQKVARASRCFSRSWTTSTPPAMQAATKSARSGRSGVHR